MGAVTAREVLALLERRGARLVAGEAGLDRFVTWASAMRARPPAFESPLGDELALLSLATLRTLQAQDDTLTLARLIQDLAERGVSAIAVAGLLPFDHMPADRPHAPAAGFDLAAAPAVAAGRPAGDTTQRPATDEERELAETLALPLVALPAGTPLAEMEREVIALAARRALAAEPRPEADTARAVYEALLRASLRGGDDRALGQRMASQLGVAVVLEDATDVRWCALPGAFPLTREALMALLRRPSARAEVRGRGGAGEAAADGGAGAASQGGTASVVRTLPLGSELVRLVASLEVWPRDRAEEARGGGPGAGVYLSLVTGEAASDVERRRALAAALEQAAPLFALALARRQDLAGVERRLRVETLDALLAGTYSDEGQMRARAAQLGHDLAEPHAALVVELSGGSGGTSVAGAVGEALAAGLDGAWVRARGAEVVALVPLAGPRAGPGEMADLAARGAELLERAAGEVGWTAGIGEPGVGPAEVRRSYGEARDAARLGRLVLGTGRVARPSELGIYRLLLRLREGGELEEFCQRTLGPLIADVRTGEALLETLEVFFACNANLSEAARRLHLHRNSLIYRLNRARELLGHDLEDPEARLALQLALKGRRVLEVGES